MPQEMNAFEHSIADSPAENVLRTRSADHDADGPSEREVVGYPDEDSNADSPSSG